MNDILIVMALKQESQGLIEELGYPVLYTGLGKVNASYFLTKAIKDRQQNGQKLKMVINFGTAGSAKFKQQELVECTQFVQRDMNLQAVGVPAGVTPFENIPARLEVPKRLSWLPSAICGSADSLELDALLADCEVFDMEAYALAKVCHFEGLAFLSVKFVTDSNDRKLAEDFKRNLASAARAFQACLTQVSQFTLHS